MGYLKRLIIKSKNLNNGDILKLGKYEIHKLSNEKLSFFKNDIPYLHNDKVQSKICTIWIENDMVTTETNRFDRTRNIINCTHEEKEKIIDQYRISYSKKHLGSCSIF